AWWDAAIMVWMYWVGIVRIALVAAGWALSLTRLTVRLVVGFIRDVVGAPFAMSSMLVRAYFRPGVPWLAFVALIFWCVLEAAIFAYTLHPRVAVLVADLAGADDVAWLTAPILYLMVLALTLASFVCVQALVDAVRKHDVDWLHGKSDEALELLALPVIHLLGAALNFAMILTASRPVFNLPFRSLREVTETRDAQAAMHFDPHKQVSV